MVTGVGVVAPCGIGADAFWSGLARTPEPGSVREVVDFSAEGLWPSPAMTRRHARFTQFAVAAADQALKDAGLEPEPSGTDGSTRPDPTRVGVYIGNSSGGSAERDAQVLALEKRGRGGVSPLLVPMAMPNSGAAAVSIRWGFRGPCETASTACASGTHSIISAMLAIAHGRVDVAVAGGAEASLTPTVITAYENMRALASHGVSRPFDTAREGFCLSEGAGVLVLESAEHAARRRAPTVYAELAGGASNADAHHMTAPSPGGRGALECMRLALADAGIASHEITHINAHGTSTPANDAAEAAAIRELFGAVRPTVTSIKGVTGHSLGGAGAVEAVSLALSFAERAIPPTLGTSEVDPALDIDVALERTTWEPGPALSNSFGFGGHNGTLVFRPA
ncbi:beta-ketoacyl-[acyl-carrier-protein] synthase family protein [Nocardiopsis dassonvillei]|uniref:beta-ketoacyl-[acyl-carrier-protein] synthase family protein n=1 Tax=Nocardiopsis dassonvillei TaxID=2014 RepID=UPI003F566B5C